MKEPKASIICVFNNPEKLKSELLASIPDKNDIELVLMNNIDNKYKSASEALNLGVSQAKGNVLIFSHQDIYIKSQRELDSFIDRIYNGQIGDIYGAQGAKETQRNNISNITAGKQLDKNYLYMIKKPICVSCVDEGFFGMKRETFDLLGKFDVNLCDNWHLYSVEISLRARKNGFHVYADPIQLHHFSYGRISKSYMKGLIRLCDAYRDSNKYVWTTCYKVSTNYFSIRILYLIWYLHRKVIGKPLE